MKRTFLLLVLILSLHLGAQTNASKFTVSGHVKDNKTGEEMIGVTVRIKELSGVGAATNVYGFYSLTVPQGSYKLIIQYIGYVNDTLDLDLSKNQTINRELKEQSQELQEITITTEKEDFNITSNNIGVIKLDVKALEKIPVLFGEKDILKTISLFPGVKSAGEGNSGFYVRGGSIDQNLILLDEATVYNASHLLGFFSVFNSDAIKDVTLYKGGMPAEYGGRISSVMDIKMNEGNSKRLGVSGGLGLIASRLAITGPIVKNKGSFLISGRRTYADLFLKLSKGEVRKSSQLYFYDLNLKANYTINDKNRVFLSGYFGRDVFNYKKIFGFDWGNATGTFRWNHLFGPKLFSNTSLVFSDYRYTVRLTLEGDDNHEDLKFKIISGIRDYNVKQDFSYFHSSRSTIKFGLNGIYHNFIPGVVILEADKEYKLEMDRKNALEAGAYMSHEFSVSEKLKVTYGLRYSLFSLIGPGTFYTYDENGYTTDTTTYKNNQVGKTYHGLDPRININYILNKSTSVKASYSKARQFIHLLSNSGAGNPTDLWVPTSMNIKPEVGDQYSLGFFKNFKENKFESSVEVYYKELYNQVEYKNGANILFNETVESQLLYGRGWCYGAEFFLKKRTGKFTGWISYTLARALRKFQGIDNGRIFSARQDRIHDLAVVLMYDFTKRLTVATTFVYYTGNAVTFPSGKYMVDGQVVTYYTERNGYRMPAYHRLDLGVTYEFKPRRGVESNLNFSIYNVYAHENAFSISFKPDPNDPTTMQAVQLSLFKIVPSLTYNFKF